MNKKVSGNITGKTGENIQFLKSSDKKKLVKRTEKLEEGEGKCFKRCFLHNPKILINIQSLINFLQ